MPTREAITNTIVAQEPKKEIPVRVVQTKVSLKKVEQNQPPPQNTNQTSTIETAPAAASVPVAESITLSPQVSALARKEQAFRQRQLALKQSEEAHASDLALAREYKELKEKLSAKDFSVAEKLGLNYDEYVKYKVSELETQDPNVQAVKTLEQKFQNLEKNLEEKDEQQFNETVSAYRSEIAKAVSTNPEFSTIKELKRPDGTSYEDAVLQFILDTWEEDKEEVSVEDACKLVEDMLVEQGKAYSSTTKLKPKQADPLPPPRTGVRTLTNQMQGPAVESKPAIPLHKLSENERYMEARRRALARRQQQG